jgi:Fur family peroxide stress response transcriptional regulator
MIQTKSAPEQRLDSVVGRLKAAGYRLTPQRLAVLKTLVESNEHPSVEEIFRQVQTDFPTTSLATVYNTLECLKDLDEVLVLPSSGASRYDGRNPEPHPHLLCTACGHIEDLEIDVSATVASVTAETGYTHLRHRLEFHGLCPRCQKET